MPIPEGITLISPTFSPQSLEALLEKTHPFITQAHLRYPADNLGPSFHLPSFFYFSKILRDPSAAKLIAGDLGNWITSNKIPVDVIFAPADPEVKEIVKELSRMLNKPSAFLKVLPSGRFGESIEGKKHLTPGKNVLIFNGVSTTGRCVGLRLPQFAEQNHANVSAIAAFAKGSSPGVKEAEQKFHNRFYSAIQVNLPLYPAEPQKCPLCQQGISLEDWNEKITKGNFA